MNLPKRNDVLARLAKANEAELNRVTERLVKLLTDATELPVAVPSLTFGSSRVVRESAINALKAAGWRVIPPAADEQNYSVE